MTINRSICRTCALFCSASERQCTFFFCFCQRTPSGNRHLGWSRIAKYGPKHWEPLGKEASEVIGKYIRRRRDAGRGCGSDLVARSTCAPQTRKAGGRSSKRSQRIARGAYRTRPDALDVTARLVRSSVGHEGGCCRPCERLRHPEQSAASEGSARGHSGGRRQLQPGRPTTHN